jgi:hypothetical protein
MYELKNKQNEIKSEQFKKSIEKGEKENEEWKKKMEVMKKSNEQEITAMKIENANNENAHKKKIESLENDLQYQKQQYINENRGYQDQITSLKKDLEEMTNTEKKNQETIDELQAKISVAEENAKIFQEDAKVAEINFKRRHEQNAEEYKKEISKFSDNLIELVNSRMEKTKKLN